MATKNAQTTAARLARIERALESLVAAKAAPAQAKAASPAPDGFVTFLREKAAAKLACEIHDEAACTRRFSPASSGRTNHVARIA